MVNLYNAFASESLLSIVAHSVFTESMAWNRLVTLWILSSTLVLHSSAQHVFPKCASLCAMNAGFDNGCYVSDVSCLCRSIINQQDGGRTSGATCFHYMCSKEDQEHLRTVIENLCGQELILWRRGVENGSPIISPTISTSNLVSTITVTSILPPAGNKTQSVTEIYTTTTTLPAATTGSTASTSTSPVSPTGSTSDAVATLGLLHISLSYAGVIMGFLSGLV